MEELLRSNDLVYLSFVCHVLEEEGIAFLRLDEHMSALEGSIGALPRRILVPSAEVLRAKMVIGKAQANLSGQTAPDFDA